MSLETQWRLVLTGASCVGAAMLFVVAMAISQERFGFVADEHIYDTSFGSVLCQSARRSPCGITLTKCHDGHVYECMLNVRERGE